MVVLHTPCGLCCSDEALYVADAGLHAVSVFRRTTAPPHRFGPYARRIGGSTRGDAPGEFDTPRDVACDARGSLLYVAEARRVQVCVRR